MPIHRGDTLFSMSLVLSLVMLAAPIGYQRYTDYFTLQYWHTTASHMNVVKQGAELYIKDNYSTLTSRLKNEALITVTGKALQDAGYIPPAFNVYNNEGQAYRLFITSKESDHKMLVSLLLTEGGQPLSYKGLRYIAQNLDGQGGYVESNNMASGADGGWHLNLADLNIPSESGHLINYLSADYRNTYREESDRLYRYQVEGRPDLNQMHADIDMNGQDVKSAREIKAQTGIFSGNVGAERVVGHKVVWSDGNVMAQADIRSQSGSLVTHGNKGWINETHQGGFYMDDDYWIKSWQGKGIITAGEVRAGTLHSEGRLTADEYLKIKGSGTVNAACEESGLIASGGANGLMACQNGRWISFEKSNRDFQPAGNFIARYSGTNATQDMVWVMAYGGNSRSNRMIGEGKCSNTSSLVAKLNGRVVQNSTNNNINYYSSASVIFGIPSGMDFEVVSEPARNLGCDSGSFSLFFYQ